MLYIVRCAAMIFQANCTSIYIYIYIQYSFKQYSNRIHDRCISFHFVVYIDVTCMKINFHSCSTSFNVSKQKINIRIDCIGLHPFGNALRCSTVFALPVNNIICKSWNFFGSFTCIGVSHSFELHTHVVLNVNHFHS